MGGRVSIVNKTSFTIRVQLCHISPLYSKTVNPNEIWSQETGAVHFTIKIDIQDSKISYAPQSGLVLGERQILEKLDGGPEVEKAFHLSSTGWYFRGDNELEIVGGPRIEPEHVATEATEIQFQPLRIVRKDKKEKKHLNLTPKPPRKNKRSRSVSVGRKSDPKDNGNNDFNGNWSTSTNKPSAELITSLETSKSAPGRTPIKHRGGDEVKTEQESGLDIFFTNLAQGQPHIRVKSVKSPT